MMNINPDNNPSITHDLARLYQDLHGELSTLEPHEPPATDQSEEAGLIRHAIAWRRTQLRALATAIGGGLPASIGQHVVPLGEPMFSVN